MKKIIVFMAFLIAGATSACLHAQQQTEPTDKAARKAQREAERARQKAQEQMEQQISYEEALAALKERQFVLEANQLMFRRGQTAYVTSNTNFVMLDQTRGVVQVAFNTPNPGPNGIGGVTVEGNVSDFKTSTDKKGNISCSFNIMGTGISAQVFLTLPKGSSNATATISPNFNNNKLTLAGNLVPLEQSDIYKGRSW